MDNSPRFSHEIVEDTKSWRIERTNWGATVKNWKDHGGVPEFLDFVIKDRESRKLAKARMTPTPDRVNWDKLAFHGGINAALYWEPEKLWAHMKEVIPVIKKGGGYVLSTDHSVPDSVSLEQFREFVRLGKELGTY